MTGRRVAWPSLSSPPALTRRTPTKRSLAFLCSSKESHISKSDIFRSNPYNRLDVADTGFVKKSRRVSCSFTVDLDLYLAVSNLGRKVVNFNHLKDKYLL